MRPGLRRHAVGGSAVAAPVVSRNAAAVVVLGLLTATLAACAAGSNPAATATSGPAAATSPPSVETTITPSPPVTSGGLPRSSVSPPPDTNTTAVPPPNAGVTILRTGGIAGVIQEIQIAADGSWTFTDRRTGESQQGKLTTAQRENVAALAVNPAIVAESRAVAPPGSCADGYIYTIMVGEVSARYEQCGGNKRPVTDQLLTVVLDATPM